MNNLIDKYYTINNEFNNFKKTLNKFNDSLLLVKLKKQELNFELNELFLNYSLKDIIALIDIKNITKEELCKEINYIQIYNEIHEKEQINIKYKFRNSSYHFFMITSDVKYNNLIKILKDEEYYKTYDIIEEFKSFEFNKLGNQILDFYIKTYFEEECLHLGLMLFSYYFLLNFKEYVRKDTKPWIIIKKNIIELNKIFNMNVRDILNTI